MTPDDKPEIDLTILPESEGVYRVAISGIVIGHIEHIDKIRLPVAPTGIEPAPANLKGLALLRWVINKEAAYNPFTQFELYICLVGFVQGAFFLLPYNSFDHLGVLWYPLRSAIGTESGEWYKWGAEVFMGSYLTLLNGSNLLAIIMRRNGDRIRRQTICLLFLTWVAMSVMFYVADPQVQNFATCLVVCGFMFQSLSAVFRKAGTR